MIRRYEIHDDFGCIRKFLTKDEANNWLRLRKEFFLKVIKEEKFDINKLGDCLL